MPFGEGVGAEELEGIAMVRKTTRAMGRMPAVFGVGLLLLVSMTAGCASERSDRGGRGDSGGHTGTGAGTSTSLGTPSDTSAALPQLALQRTGGFAGLNDTVTVDPHGTWSATNRAGTRTAGALTADQLAELRRLATDARLVAEAGQRRPPTTCRDAFTYRLTVGGTRIEYVDCPSDPNQPVASIALVKALLGSTISSPTRGS